MAHTQAQLTALETALASGVTRVSYGDHVVEYQTADNLRKAIADVKADLARQGTTTPTRHVRIYTTKGT